MKFAEFVPNFQYRFQETEEKQSGITLFIHCRLHGTASLKTTSSSNFLDTMSFGICFLGLLRSDSGIAGGFRSSSFGLSFSGFGSGDFGTSLGDD